MELGWSVVTSFWGNPPIQSPGFFLIALALIWSQARMCRPPHSCRSQFDSFVKVLILNLLTFHHFNIPLFRNFTSSLRQFWPQLVVPSTFGYGIFNSLPYTGLESWPCWIWTQQIPDLEPVSRTFYCTDPWTWPFACSRRLDLTHIEEM